MLEPMRPNSTEKALGIPELLEFILKLVPKKKRRELMFVSKSFRDAVYKIEEPKSSIKIFDETVSFKNKFFK